MNVSSIGVQVIMPKTGTSSEFAPQQQANERAAANEPAAKEAPPPPGMGKYIDKTV